MRVTQLLCFLVSLIYSALSLPCLPGTFANTPDEACRPCPRGRYQNATTAVPMPCVKCPRGTFNPFKGVRDENICQPCPLGTFSEKAGLKSPSGCQACPKGTVSAGSARKCVAPCPKGSFLRTGGFPRCVKCPAGTISLGGAAPRCEKCQNGLVPRNRRSECKHCPRGMEITSDLTKCVKCTRFRYNPGTFLECRECPSLLLGNKEVGASRCVACPVRMARKGEFENVRCAFCPGKLNQNAKRPMCVKDGTPCPSNHFEDSDGVCRRCEYGERLNVARMRCVKCAEDETSLGGVSTECIKCGKNEIGGEQCECQDGFETTPTGCKECPPGTRFVRLRDFGISSCVPCDFGTYSAGGAAPECIPCPQGSVQPLEGQASCITCQRGMVASNLRISGYPTTIALIDTFGLTSVRLGNGLTRSECVLPTTNCPLGTVRITGRSGGFYCEPSSCPRDTFEVRGKVQGTFSGPGRFAEFARVCITCPTQSRFDREQGRCVACGPRIVSPGGLSETCTSCERNFATTERGTKCICVQGINVRFPTGVFLKGNGLCVKCPSGSFGLFRKEGCQVCERDWRQPKTRETDRCPRCDAGEELSKRGGTFADCSQCPDGFMTYGLGDTCVKIGGDV